MHLDGLGIGPLRPGCELAPFQRIAKLLPPLKGIAVFNHRDRRLSALTFTVDQTTKRISAISVHAPSFCE